MFDWVFTYSHLLTNFIFVYIAIYYKVTLYSLVMVTSVSVFYVQLSSRSHVRAMDTYHESALLEQTDLKMAGLITKKF